MDNSSALIDVLNRAWSLLTTGNGAAAEEIYAKVLGDRPDCVEARHGMARAKFELGDHGLALENIDWVLKVKSKNPRHLDTAGRICHGCGEVDAALLHYRNALKQIDEAPKSQEKSYQDLRREVSENLRSLVLFGRDVYEELIPSYLNQGDVVGAATLKLKIGNLCKEVGWNEHAIFHYRQGLAFRPVVDPTAPLPLKRGLGLLIPPRDQTVGDSRCPKPPR